MDHKYVTHHIQSNYTLSHPENDRDVTERAQGYMHPVCVNPGVAF